MGVTGSYATMGVCDYTTAYRWATGGGHTTRNAIRHHSLVVHSVAYRKVSARGHTGSYATMGVTGSYATMGVCDYTAYRWATGGGYTTRNAIRHPSLVVNSVAYRKVSARGNTRSYATMGVPGSYATMGVCDYTAYRWATGGGHTSSYRTTG